MDVLAWSPALVQQYLNKMNDVEYSLPSCRRFLKKARLSHQELHRIAIESNADGQETFCRELKKVARNGHYNSLYRSNQENRLSRTACRLACARLLSYPDNAAEDVSWG